MLLRTLDRPDATSPRHFVEASNAPSSSFAQNTKLPVHRWFRYPAGFSGAWAEQVIRSRTSASVVFDPFAGVATTLIAAELAGRKAIGLEAHPFVARVGSAKLRWRNVDRASLTAAAARVAKAAKGIPATSAKGPEPALLASAFSAEALGDLRRLLHAIERTTERGSDEHELLWLALVATLRPCSRAGTAPWQYVLPRRPKARVASPMDRFAHQIATILEDVRTFPAPSARLMRGDARECAELQSDSVDLVLTSPPYPNNYDYADATRLEQTFLGEVDGWGDLQAASRRFLVRACSQHASTERLQLEEVLADVRLGPIRDGLVVACERLDRLRRVRRGKKAYHTMIAAYFSDMARVWIALGRVVRPGGHALFVIGDSAPYGVHIPVEEWMRELADAAGFSFVGFSEVRKRNVKWKNRKHRVPLKEGELLLRRRGA